MKYLVLVVLFFGVPLWLLNNFVLPDLLSLKNTYANVDAIAQRAAAQQ